MSDAEREILLSSLPGRSQIPTGQLTEIDRCISNEVDASGAIFPKKLICAGPGLNTEPCRWRRMTGLVVRELVNRQALDLAARSAAFREAQLLK